MLTSRLCYVMKTLWKTRESFTGEKYGNKNKKSLILT